MAVSVLRLDLAASSENLRQPALALVRVGIKLGHESGETHLLARVAPVHGMYDRHIRKDATHPHAALAEDRR